MHGSRLSNVTKLPVACISGLVVCCEVNAVVISGVVIGSTVITAGVVSAAVVVISVILNESQRTHFSIHSKIYRATDSVCKEYLNVAHPLIGIKCSGGVAVQWPQCFHKFGPIK